MGTLHSNWLTEGHIDFEYKKYLLLAYLQDANMSFDAWKIYPFLGELIQHYNNLVLWNENKKAVEEKIPGTISGIDLENMRIDFERIMNKEEYLQVVEEIIAFALPLFQEHIHRARDMYETVEAQLSISSVGIVPMHTDAGYLLFRIPGTHNTDVFAYSLTIFEQAHIPFRGLKTQFLERYPHSYLYYDEAIKTDLIRKHKEFPNPATYVVESKYPYPFAETIFPVVKRSFVRFLSTQT